MELNEEDYNTVVTIRVPLSLAKQIDSFDWGLGRKPSRSKKYLTAVQNGIQFLKLKQLQNDPEKKKELEQKLADLMLTSPKDQEQVLQTMDISGLETIISMANATLDTKISQKILDF